MKEDFLHYVWRYRLFNSHELIAQTGEEIKVHHPGIYNVNGGPDFLNARIQIGKTLWVGHVEIHIKSSDWHRHGHTEDEHYKNVILHVVYDNDQDIFLRYPGDLAVLECRKLIEQDALVQYDQWMVSKLWIPCGNAAAESPEIIRRAWLDRLATERLQMKTDVILNFLKRTNGNWMETFYRMIARSFGFKVNNDAFELLAEALPLSVLLRHRSDPFQVEALLFGQAGFLNGRFVHEYPERLRKEYEFLQHKYSLKPMCQGVWQFAKMRPSNFPTLRIAQLGALICQYDGLFSEMFVVKSYKEIIAALRSMVPDYWESHYRFLEVNETEKTQNHLFEKLNNRRKRSCALSEAAAAIIVINAWAPTMLAYGKAHGDGVLIEGALTILAECAPESNGIANKWKERGIESSSALDSQALIQLFQHYCSRKRCLECAIGLYLIRSKKETG